MEKRKTFKVGEELGSLAQFVKVAADELTGDTGEACLPASIRITVTTVGNSPPVYVGTLLKELELEPATADVMEFLEYRETDKRNPIRSIRALRRILLKFRERPDWLRASIDEAISNGWTGLFVREPKTNHKTRKVDDGQDSGAGAEW